MTSVPFPRADDRAERVAQPAPVFGWLFWLAVLGVVGAVIRAIYFTPPEATQGLAQKIYYLHVPAALSTYLGFTIVALASIVYLWLRDERADRLAEAGAEVGLVFNTVVLTTGPLWGKPIWGTWWTWDARLTLTLFLWFIYATYIVLRGAIEERGMRARYSAVLGVLGACLIPFIHLSVYLFRTLHPMPIVLAPQKPQLPSDMLLTFALSSFAFLFFCLMLVRARYRYGVQRDALLALTGEEG